MKTNVAKILLVCLLTILYSSLAQSAEKSPSDYINNFVEGDKVHWFGEIISGRAYRAKNGGTTIEWLCRFYELAEPVQPTDIVGQTKKRLVKVKNSSVQYFTVLQGPMSNPLEAIQPMVSNILKDRKYLIATGVTQKVVVFDGMIAVSIMSDIGSVAITPSIEMQFIE